MGLGSSLILQAELLVANDILIELMGDFEIVTALRNEFLGHVMLFSFPKVHDHNTVWLQPLIALLEEGRVDVE